MVIVCRSFRELGSKRYADLECKDPSLAVQASKDEADLNVIVKKYLRTGELPQTRQVAYMDLSAMPNLQEALHMVADAEAAFMDIPADVRKYFDNDPVKLVAFASDDKNHAKAIELGLIPPPAPPVSAAGQAAPGGVPASPQPPNGGPNS